MTRARQGVLAVGLLALGACKPAAGSASNSPARPAPKLVSVVAELSALAAHAPAEPSAATKNELAELVDLAFHASDARLAARSERALLGHDQRMHGLERGVLHEDAVVRARCAYELGRLGSKAAVPHLVFCLKYEKDARARVWIAAALAALGNGAGLGVLAESLQTEGLADEAARSALELATRTKRDLGESPTWDAIRTFLREIEAGWLATGKDICEVPAVEGAETHLTARLARHMLATDGFQLRPVDEARFVMARVGVAALPLLKLALGAQEVYLRNHALEVLTVLGRPGAPLVKETLALLGDRLSARFALAALGSLGAPDAAPDLLRETRSEDPELRCAAAAALGELGHAAAKARLEELVRDANELMDVRVRAALGLALLGGAEGKAFLEERKAKADYHEPTIAALLDRVAKPR